MNPQEMFAIWAPDQPDDEFGPTWTSWAKPVLFASINAKPPGAHLHQVDLRDLRDALRRLPGKYALVIDLPGPEAIAVGFELARLGMRPVPLFNGCPGDNEVVSTSELIAALRAATPLLERCAIPADAWPAFLLDSRRMSTAVAPQPGRFDNRWFTFPQDFPSANLLLARGFQTIIVVQERVGQPADDLAHVLRRWQEAGVELRCTTLGSSQLQPLKVDRPKRFRNLWYLMLALVGLFPNSAGGFGAVIPQPSSGG